MRTRLRITSDAHAPERHDEPSGVIEQPLCAGCHRTPLIGERVGVYADGSLRCELCVAMLREAPVSESLVRHQPDGPRSRVRVIRRLP